MIYRNGILLIFFWFLLGCDSSTTLPILGKSRIINNDTIYPTIADFSFKNQDGVEINSKTFNNKIYIADFIFLSCPTICPKMTSELYKVYEIYQNDTNILYLSHTIDPERDTIERLKNYSNSLGIDSKKWFFVTGDKKAIYELAETSYFATAYEDHTAPGGYIHSGGVLLIDKKKQIRGVYDGTNQNETQRLIKDIAQLLKEQF